MGVTQRVVTMIGYLVLLCLSASSQAQNTVATLATQVINNAATVTTLQTRMAGLQRATVGVDLAPVIVMDATLSSGTTKCGPQTITGWTENIDYWYKATGGVQTTSQFTP